MIEIYRLSANPHIIRQIPYTFSRFKDSQNPAFAFFAKTVLSDDTLIDIMTAVGTDVEYILDVIINFYRSSFGKCLCDTNELNIVELSDINNNRDHKNFDFILAKFANPVLMTIRCLINDMLYSSLMSNCEELDTILEIVPISDDTVINNFIEASRAGDRVSKSIKEALKYLSTVADGVTIDQDGIHLNGEMKPLLTSLTRSYAHILIGGGRLRWLNEELASSEMMVSINSIMHTLLLVIDEDMYKKNDDEAEDEIKSNTLLIVDKFLFLLLGENPDLVANLMNYLSKLAVSNIRMVHGIAKNLVKSDVGIKQSSMSSGKKLKRTTPKMKSLYNDHRTRDSVLQRISKRELPQTDRMSIEKVGEGDLYVMIDVSGSTMRTYGSSVGIFLLFEAMGIAIVSAARATNRDCTVMFYGDSVTHQVDFRTTDTEVSHRRKVTELTNQTGPHGNNELVSLQWAFEQVRRRNGKKPTTIMMITDGGVLTEYGSGDADPVDQFKIELGMLKTDVQTNITILPIIVNPNLDENFRKAFTGTEFVHIKKGDDLTPKVLTDIMRYVVTLDPHGNETIKIVPS